MNIPSRVNPFSYDNTLPPGYFRVDFLESTSGRLYIVTDYYQSTSTGVEISVDCELLGYGGTVTSFACSLVPADNGSPWGFGMYSNGYANFSPFSNKNLYYGSTPVRNKRCLFKLRASSLWIDGVEDTRSMYGAWSSSQAWYTARPLTLFCANQSDEGWDLRGPAMKAYRFTASVSGKVARDFIPVIDFSGTPCMFDLVTKKTFYKENNSVYDFVVGMNMEQALNLAKLPVTKNGELTVSMPMEVALDDNVQRALEAAAAKGWHIPVQYRESEVATANLEVDFLESDGLAMMTLPFESKNKSFVCEHTLGMPKATSGLFAYGGTAVSSGYAIIYRAAQQGFAFVGGDYIASGKFLRGEKYKILWKVTRNEEGKFIFSLENDGKVLKEITQSYNQYWRNVYYVFGSTNYNTLIGGTAYEVTISIEGELTCHAVPALDTTGTPCMHDTVSGQNFYNAATTGSDFIVGFDTIKKAAVSLSKLPVTTDGTLTVSLPAEAEGDTLVDEACRIAQNRGWTIFPQYRTN